MVTLAFVHVYTRHLLWVCVVMVLQEVWSLTQFYSVSFLQSRTIVIKRVFYCKHTNKVCVSCFNGAMGNGDIHDYRSTPDCVFVSLYLDPDVRRG